MARRSSVGTKSWSDSLADWHSLKHHRRADAVWRVGIRHLARQGRLRFPARAVLGYEHGGIDLLEGGDRRRDDWLEDGAREVEAADDGVNLLDAGQTARVA